MSGLRDHSSSHEGVFDIETTPFRNPIQSLSLPAPRTSFIGRSQEIALVRKLVERRDLRIVTITGPGGVGKSRLATEALAGIDRTAHMVDLSDVQEAELVLSTIAASLGLNAPGRPDLDSVVSGLRGFDLVLALDNFEHLLPAANELTQLLDACTGVTLLVTSRAVLDLPGERVVILQPFPLPLAHEQTSMRAAAGLEACRLFVERAQELAPEFELTTSNSDSIVHICTRLDGLPLAIELAASWIRVLTPQALLSQLNQCLELPSAGTARPTKRHRTLQHTIAWSYGLLGPAAQATLRRLSVFNGGCTLDACLAICADPGVSVLNELRTLIANSLIRRVDHSHGDSRYIMLETVREFALAQLEATGEATEMRRRHAMYMLSVARTIESQIDDVDHDRWIERLQWEAGNLQSAVACAIESEHAELAFDLFGTLLPLWQVHARSSIGRELAKRARSIPGEVSGPVLRRALFSAGTLEYMHGDIPQARHLLSDAHRQFVDAGEDVMAGRTELALGRIAWDQGELESANCWVDSATRRFERTHNRAGFAQGLHYQGLLAWSAADFETAGTRLREAMRIWQSFGFEGELAGCIPGHLADIARDAGNPSEATARYQECLAKNWAWHNSENIAWSLAGLAFLACSTGQKETAASFLALAERVAESIGAPLTPHIERDQLRTRSMVIDAIGQLQYEAARTAARECDLEAGIAIALAWSLPEPLATPSERFGEGLTLREREVLRWIAAGKSNQEIANILFLSIGTVKVHVTHILGKLGVRSRSAAVDYAHRHRLA